MVKIRKVSSTESYPSRRKSGDVLQPEGEDKHFSKELEEHNDISRTSVSETQQSTLNEILRERQERMAIRRKREREKEKEEEKEEETDSYKHEAAAREESEDSPSPDPPGEKPDKKKSTVIDVTF